MEQLVLSLPYGIAILAVFSILLVLVVPTGRFKRIGMFVCLILLTASYLFEKLSIRSLQMERAIAGPVEGRHGGR